MEVVVVGGGIGGLAVAGGLHRRGHAVTVLEQTAEFSVVGAAISLWPNAFRALDAVGADVHGERLAESGGLRDWRGRWIVHADPALVAERGAQVAVVHRHDLRTALLTQVPEECRMNGVRARGVRVEGDRVVVEHDGGELAADLVIGADGVRSVVRAALWPRAEAPRYVGRTACGWSCPGPRG